MKRFWIIKRFKSFGYSIQSLIRWFPIIWKDRDWDYYFLEDMIIHKLKNMSKFYQDGKNVYSAEAENVAKEINEVIDLLERIQEDDYESKIDSHFNDWIVEDRPITIEKITDNQVCRVFNSPNFSEEELIYRKRVYELARELKEKERRMAYVLISKNIEKWWD